MFNFIGLRTFKTGIAVGLSVIVSQLLHLQFPFFVCMTSIFAMDKTALTSLHMGKIRVGGTLIGAILGTLFASIDRFNPILCAIGVILLITILNYLKMSQAIGIAGIVFCACMVHIDTNQISPFFYGMHRTFDSFIGMLVSLSVNLLILPNYDLNKIQKKINALTKDFNKVFNKKEVLDVNSINELQIQSSMNEIRNQLLLYENEHLNQEKRLSLNKSKAQFSVIEKIVFELQVLHSLAIDDDQTIFQYHTSRAYSFYLELQSQLIFD